MNEEERKRVTELLTEYWGMPVGKNFKSLKIEIQPMMSVNAQKAIELIDRIVERAIKDYRKSQRRISCEYCEHTYKGKNHAYKRHLLICYKNPNRTCEQCRETGLKMRFIGIRRNNFQPVYRAGEEPCDACKTAEELGGKSYIKMKLSLDMPKIDKIKQ